MSELEVENQQQIYHIILSIKVYYNEAKYQRSTVSFVLSKAIKLIISSQVELTYYLYKAGGEWCELTLYLKCGENELEEQLKNFLDSFDLGYKLHFKTANSDS